MRETFPVKKIGDDLTAKHVNDLSTVARRFAASTPGANLAGRAGGVFSAAGSMPSFFQVVVEITNNQIDGNDAEDSGLYLCKVRYYDPGDLTWKSQDREWQLDATAINISLDVGKLVTAYWHQQRGMLIPIVADEILHFELKYDLAPGGSARAYLLKWDGDSLEVDEDTEFNVFDALGLWRGRARDKFPSPHNQGSRGCARMVGDQNDLEIIQMTPHALMIRGKADDDWTASTFALTGDALKVMSPIGSLITDQDPANAFTVHDIFDWSGSKDDIVVAAWNEEDTQWEAIQISCP